MPRNTNGSVRKRPPVALRWAGIVLFLAGVGALAGFAAGCLSEPVYEASARVAMEPQAYRIADDDGPGRVAWLRSKIARIAGDDVLAQASGDVASLRRRLVVNSASGELTADIVVRADTAGRAADEANAIAEAFRMREGRAVAAQRAAERIDAERRLDAARAALSQAEQALHEARAAAVAAGPATRRDEEIERLRQELAALERAGAGGAAGPVPNSLRTVSESRDAAAAELGLLSRTYGPRHPRRVEAARRLAAAEAATRQEAERLAVEKRAAIEAASVSPAVAPAPAPIEGEEAASALATQRESLEKAEAALQALSEPSTVEPVSIVYAATPPLMRNGPSDAAYATMGAAGGVVIGLVLAALFGMARALGGGRKPTEVVLSDVSYAPVDLAGEGAALRLAPPVLRSSEPEAEPTPAPEPPQAVEPVAAPQLDEAVLARRERLRRELREMTARRQAEMQGRGAARILSAEELQRRHDEGNGPHRL